MAEQEKYGSHWNVNPNNPVKDASVPSINVDAVFRGSGAEQDRHGSHFSLGPGNPVRAAAEDFNASKFGSGTLGSEQDRFSSHFSLVRLPSSVFRLLGNDPSRRGALLTLN